jgi:hypothetical protein
MYISICLLRFSTETPILCLHNSNRVVYIVEDTGTYRHFSEGWEEICAVLASKKKAFLWGFLILRDSTARLC